MATSKRRKNANELRIRMYRVGFGDFFLMSVPSKGGYEHILIDCGVTNGKTGKGDLGTIKAAAAHMKEETNGKLALIIVTHRHQDHIIGFSRAANVFKDMEVGAVWMSAWETEYDPNEKKKGKKSLASQFQDQLTKAALGMQQRLAAGSDDPEAAEVLAMLENATGIDHQDLAATGNGRKKKGSGKGGGSNEASLNYLRSHKPQYYAIGDKPHMPKALAAAGLKAQILGPPPVTKVDFMKLMNLRKGVGQYLGDGANTGNAKAFYPFDNGWRGKASEYGDAAFREFSRLTADHDLASARQALREAIDSARPSTLFMAAKTLDGFLNNQSLVVLFTFQGKKLLFAGDAQGGNWEYWMFGGTPDKKPAAGNILPKSKTILGHLDFYKVGHHGSTNATPISAVEAMGGDFVSLCSTQADSFGKIDNESEVPRIKLMDALREKSYVVRSDGYAVNFKDPQSKAAVKAPAVKNANRSQKKRLNGRIEEGDIYVDYFL